MKSKLLAATVLTSLVALSACGPQEPTRAEVRRASPPGREIPMIDTAPQVTEAHVNFLTGGVGEDERAEIDAAKGDFNLHITNARSDGAFVEDVKTVITRKDGAEMLDVNAGPLLFVQLEPGTYTIQSTRYGEIQKKNVVIAKGAKGAKASSFIWKPMPKVVD